MNKNVYFDIIKHQFNSLELRPAYRWWNWNSPEVRIMRVDWYKSRWVGGVIVERHTNSGLTISFYIEGDLRVP